MHNIDRTVQELGVSSNGKYENACENTFAFGGNNELGQAFSPEAHFESGNFAMSPQENQKLEMAYELMTVSNETALNQFLPGPRVERSRSLAEGWFSETQAGSDCRIPPPLSIPDFEYISARPFFYRHPFIV